MPCSLPVLVFQNSIELRGASFAWLPDLSRPDPLYISRSHGLSMWGAAKVGQVGMEPNPREDDALHHAGDDEFLFLTSPRGSTSIML